MSSNTPTATPASVPSPNGGRRRRLACSLGEGHVVATPAAEHLERFRCELGGGLERGDRPYLAEVGDALRLEEGGAPVGGE